MIEPVNRFRQLIAVLLVALLVIGGVPIPLQAAMDDGSQFNRKEHKEHKGAFLLCDLCVLCGYKRQRTAALQNAVAINSASFIPTGVTDLKAGQRAAGKPVSV